jgi:myo-inositol-1(or 4)-monophosphatase
MAQPSPAELLRYAVDLVREGGALAHGYFKKRETLTVSDKGLQDVFSEADVNTELLIRGRLQRDFPGDAFLGEETGISEYAPDQGIWVLDPIDGTQPFVSGMTAWCVSLAYVRGGELQLGVVYAPARDELFAGGLGLPATLNGNPVQPNSSRTIRRGLVGIGHSPRVPPARFLAVFGPFLEAGGMFHREGSGALAICYVACGRLLGFIETHINSWDCLGGLAVVHAAGLRSNDFLAGDALRKGGPLIVGSEPVYAELEAIFRKASGRS